MFGIMEKYVYLQPTYKTQASESPINKGFFYALTKILRISNRVGYESANCLCQGVSQRLGNPFLLFPQYSTGFERS